MALAAIGCGAQTPTPRDARAAGEWTFRLPETRSPYAGLAIAHGTGEPSALSLVDDALAEAPVAAAKPRPAVKRPVAAQAKAAPAPVAQPAPQPIAVSTAATPVQPQQLALSMPPASSNDAERYAQRERQSQKQRDFRGGDAIVISAGTLVVVLLIVLLVLLLT